MRRLIRSRRAGRLSLMLALLMMLAGVVRAEDTRAGGIRGVVLSRGVPVAGATVRVQTTAVQVTTNGRGEFLIVPPADLNGARITASAPGHYIAAADFPPDGTPLVLELRALPQDEPAYTFLSPYASSAQTSACENCHAAGRGDPPTIFEAWSADAHSRSASNPRFLSVYRGTDITGLHTGPPTTFATVQDYGRIALRPDQSKPSFGPGYKLDFPSSGGNCGACHAPVASMNAPYSTELTNLPDATAGITCDFCHKIAGVRLDPASGLPHDNTPGVLGFSFLRPPAGKQLFLGPLDDVAPGGDAHSPLYEQSQYCAPCHFGRFWGIEVYNSFGEWLESPWSRGAQKRTCQDCHMPSGDATSVVPVAKGGRLRLAGTLSSHRMRGVDDPALMASAARLDLAVSVEAGLVRVRVDVTNSGTGHSLPTDYPGRNVVLIVSAFARDHELRLVDGPRVPTWAGEGDGETDYAGRAGRGYARVLRDRWTRTSPTIAYWRPIDAESDSRIRAMQTDSSTFRFEGSPPGPVRVVARLVYRRNFADVTRAKRWTDPDLLMQQKELVVATPAGILAPLDPRQQ